MCYVSLNWDDRIDVTSLFGRVVHPVNSLAKQSGFHNSDRTVLLKKPIIVKWCSSFARRVTAH